MKYILVVIDMQPKFPASLDDATIAGVIKEIGKARRSGNPIIVLEYADRGYGLVQERTHPLIQLALAGYDKVSTATKNADDGSWEVLSVQEEKGWETRNYRLCGVNTRYCVRETALGLGADFEVVVVESAVNCDSGRGYQDIGLKWAA